MALFAVNTGCRDSEICGLRWDWEVKVPELEHGVSSSPVRYVKNGDDRLVVLNRIAASVVDGRARNASGACVFLSRKARNTHAEFRVDEGANAGRLPQVRVHDLKHTFGRRLRAAGVSFEDRQDLLGHRSGRITTHYSAAELARLIDAANQVCEMDGGSRNWSFCGELIHRRLPQNSRKDENINSVKSAKSLILMVPRGGIEPPTRGFSVRCSTD